MCNVGGPCARSRPAPQLRTALSKKLRITLLLGFLDSCTQQSETDPPNGHAHLRQMRICSHLREGITERRGRSWRRDALLPSRSHQGLDCHPRSLQHLPQVPLRGDRSRYLFRFSHFDYLSPPDLANQPVHLTSPPQVLYAVSHSRRTSRIIALS